jgi:nucleotide-binding universal stress UspA family protein
VVDETKVNAELKDGVLTLRVPLAKKAQPKKIEIESAWTVTSLRGGAGGGVDWPFTGAPLAILEGRSGRRHGEAPLRRPVGRFTMYERILVPLDGSERAETALLHAERLASAFGSELLFLWVLAHAAGDGDSSPAHDYLENIRARLEATGVSGLSLTVAAGDAADAILRVVEEEQVSLVCMSTHGLGGIRRLVLGSVADAVVRRSDVPVLLIRPDEDD